MKCGVPPGTIQTSQPIALTHFQKFMLSPTRRTVIGLPLLFVAVVGIAFGAITVSRSLNREPVDSTAGTATLENSNTNTTITNQTTNSSGSTAYSLLLGSFTAQLEKDWPGTTVAHERVAAGGIAGLCWLVDHPNDLQTFPAGRIRDEWTLNQLFLTDSATEQPVCPDVDPAALTAAGQAIQQDLDTDGLNDLAEQWYGTLPTTADTDNDGFLDGQEVSNGFSPLGPGPRP